MKSLGEKTMNEVRDLALLLRPSMLDDFGLVPALNWHARETGKRTGLNVLVRAGGEADDLRQQVADLLGVTLADYTPHQMTHDLRWLRPNGLIYRPPKTNRYFVTPHGWKVARLFSRLEARVLRPAMAMFTTNDAVLPFPLRQALDRVDTHLDLLIYEAFPLPKAS